MMQLEQAHILNGSFEAKGHIDNSTQTFATKLPYAPELLL